MPMYGVLETQLQVLCSWSVFKTDSGAEAPHKYIQNYPWSIGQHVLAMLMRGVLACLSVTHNWSQLRHPSRNTGMHMHILWPI